MESYVCDIESGQCKTVDNDVSKLAMSTNKKVKIEYYTDPICSACWALEPTMRKLHNEYGEHFDLDIIMGGLLPSWDGFFDSGNGISKPEDVAHHWEDMGRHFEMPINGSVWRSDPIKSSYPPSLAYLAAKKQDEAKAKMFLRKLREQVFIFGKNITNIDVLHDAAFSIGLDVDTFEHDLTSDDIKQIFMQNLETSRTNHVRGFPTLILSGKNQPSVSLNGVRSYEDYEYALKSFIKAEPNHTSMTVEEAVNENTILATKEVADLCNLSISKAFEELKELEKKNKIRSIPVDQGYYWSANN